MAIQPVSKLKPKGQPPQGAAATPSPASTQRKPAVAMETGERKPRSWAGTVIGWLILLAIPTSAYVAYRFFVAAPPPIEGRSTD